MIRWGLFIVGLGLVVCGVIAWFQQPPISTEVRAVTVDEAVAMVAGSAKQFIEIPARLETTRRIYPTGDEVRRPSYTGNAPDQVYPIRGDDPQRANWEKHLGNMVRIEQPLDASVLRLQTVRDRALEEKKVLQERWLAPVHGSAHRLWALSDLFRGSDQQGRDWLSHRPVQGYLTRFNDVAVNRDRPAFSHDLRTIRQTAEKELGRAIPEDAFVLLTNHPKFPQPPAYFYCPIAGSGDALFYHVVSAAPANLPATLRGVLEPRPLELYADFARVLGKPLPARIGILRPISGESANQQRAANLKDVFTLGGTLAALGLIGIAWKRIRRKRTLRAE